MKSGKRLLKHKSQRFDMMQCLHIVSYAFPRAKKMILQFKASLVNVLKRRIVIFRNFSTGDHVIPEAT